MAGVETKVEQTDDRAALVARLRESKGEFEVEAAEAGREAGKAWARGAAGYGELKHLSDFTLKVGGDLAKVIYGAQACPSGVLFDAIRPDQADDADAFAEFAEAAFEGVCDSCSNNPAFVMGFIEAAVAEFDEVKDEL